MNFTANEEFNLSEDIRDIERKIYILYLKIIKDYFHLDDNFVWSAKRISSNGRQIYLKTDVFNEPGELLKLCIQDTCLALRKFYSLFEEYLEFAKYLSNNSIITIYCTSSESLFSMFGICTVINEAVEQYAIKHQLYARKIQVIVVDKRQNWRNLCNYVTKRLKSCYKNLEIELAFINENSSILSSEVFDTRVGVDIVVMARYLSSFPYVSVKTQFFEVR